jgi:hypothetical protein
VLHRRATSPAQTVRPLFRCAPALVPLRQQASPSLSTEVEKSVRHIERFAPLAAGVSSGGYGDGRS